MRSDNPTAACGMKDILMLFHSSQIAISLAMPRSGPTTVVEVKSFPPGHNVSAAVAPKNDHRVFPFFSVLGVQ
jgi:hypothetical protein